MSGADPGFQTRGGPLKKIAPSGGRREKCLGGGAGCALPPPPPPWIRPCMWFPLKLDKTIVCCDSLVPFIIK
jgi:hypothetical protein